MAMLLYGIFYLEIVKFISDFEHLASLSSMEADVDLEMKLLAAYLIHNFVSILKNNLPK
jgi:hypothetical protein